MKVEVEVVIVDWEVVKCEVVVAVKCEVVVIELVVVVEVVKITGSCPTVVVVKGTGS